MADLFIRDRLTTGEPLLFAWAMLPGEHQAEAYARHSAEGVLCDLQHGLISYDNMIAMIRAIHKGGKPAFVRPPLEDFAMVSRALDAGAAAVIMPMINTAEDAHRLVSAAKYPPVGERSWGPFSAMQASGLDAPGYLSQANELIRVFGMIETGNALANIGQICAVPGLDGIFVGPYDLSISLSQGAEAGASHSGVQEALAGIVAAARNAGKIAGIYASNLQQVQQFSQLGFKFISVASDRSIIDAGAAAVMPKTGARA